MARVNRGIDEHQDEIVTMALSDKVSFDAIQQRFGITEDQLKMNMKRWLKGGSYKAWRRRVERFRQQRQVYKSKCHV